MVAKGEVDIAKVRQKIKDTFKTDKEVEQVAEYYADAYAGTGMTAQEIWEECICDSLGDMNIFAKNKEVAGAMDYTIKEMQKAVVEQKTEPNKTRGSPEAEGKASRENNDEKHNNLVVKSSNKNGENYGLKLRTYSLDEIAQLYDKADYGAEYDVLFNKVYEFCKNMNIVFSVEPEIVNEKGNQIAGQSIGDKVKLNRRIFNDPNISNQRKSQAILHEMIHSSTVYATVKYREAIREGRVSELPNNIKKAAKDIYTVYTAIKNNPNFDGEYALEKPEEMVAQLAKPVFVEKLKGSYPSTWHKLLETICELFGINKQFTNYAKLKKAVDRLLADPDYALANAYYDSVADKNAYYLDESKYTDLDSKGKFSRELDTDYMTAVEQGDMETAQKMVDEAA